MDKAVADVATWRFSTDTLPEQERGAALHAVSGRKTVAAYEALADFPVYADFTQRRLPGLVLLTGAVEAGRVERTRRHLADGVVDLCLGVNLGGGGGVWFGRGREVISEPGNAVLWSCAEPITVRPIMPVRGADFLHCASRARRSLRS
jgi:hypothetical protein